MIRNAHLLVPLAAAVAFVTAAVAAPSAGGTADGTTAIDQSKVLNGSITPGDAPGFPIKISVAGQYRLTSNLTVPSSVHGFVIAEGVDATIDLNGFSITGAATCSKTVNCHSLYGTSGVKLGDKSSATISNGRIRGFSAAGVGGELQPSAKFTVVLDHVRLANNGAGAMATYLLGTRVVAEQNAQYGLVAYYVSIADSFAHQNGLDGFGATAGTIRSSMAIGNTRYGLTAGGPVALQDNATFLNGIPVSLSTDTAGQNNTFK